MRKCVESTGPKPPVAHLGGHYSHASIQSLGVDDSN